MRLALCTVPSFCAGGLVENFTAVLRTPELGPGEVREVEAFGRTLALANVGQTYYAVDAHCPNDGTNLARDGRLAGYTLECPADGSAYDIRTGARTGPDSGPALARYPIRVEGNLIYVGRMRMAA